MKNLSIHLVIICFLSLLMPTQQETLAPFAILTGNIPGGTYDLGTLASTDVIKIAANFVPLT